MFGGGREEAVAESRVELSEAIRGSLVQVVERNVGRKVGGFMSSSHQHPDLLAFVFVFETASVLERVDTKAED